MRCLPPEKTFNDRVEGLFVFIGSPHNHDGCRSSRTDENDNNKTCPHWAKKGERERALDTFMARLATFVNSGYNIRGF